MAQPTEIMTLLELRDEINAFMEEYPFAANFTPIVSADEDSTTHHELEKGSMTITKVSNPEEYHLELDDLDTPEEGNAVWLQ